MGEKVFTTSASRRIAAAVRFVEQLRHRLGDEGDLRRLLIPHELSRFELIEDLTPGDSASAHRVIWENDDYVAKSEMAELTVVDFLGNLRVETGRQGVAWKVHDRDVWEIFSIEHQARWIKFAVTENFGTGDSSVAIDGITYFDGYEPSTEPTTVENTGQIGLDNDEGLAFFNPADGKYYIVAMVPVETDVMVDYRVNDSNNMKIETLWRKICTRYGEAATSDWVTEHTGTACT